METVNLINSVTRPESRPQSSAVTVTAETTPVQSNNDAVRQNSAISGRTVPNQQSVQEKKTTSQTVQESVSELNNFVQKIQRSIQFSINDTTGQTVISVKDTVTGEEIRTIPSEELVAIAEYLAESLAVSEEAGRGLLMNLQA